MTLVKDGIKECTYTYRAVAEGYDQIWSLAEYFGVTEDFMRKALCWHVYGNVESQLYF